MGHANVMLRILLRRNTCRCFERATTQYHKFDAAVSSCDVFKEKTVSFMINDCLEQIDQKFNNHNQAFLEVFAHNEIRIEADYKAM